MVETAPLSVKLFDVVISNTGKIINVNGPASIKKVHWCELPWEHLKQMKNFVHTIKGSSLAKSMPPQFVEFSLFVNKIMTIIDLLLYHTTCIPRTSHILRTRFVIIHIVKLLYKWISLKKNTKSHGILYISLSFYVQWPVQCLDIEQLCSDGRKTSYWLYVVP